MHSSGQGDIQWCCGEERDQDSFCSAHPVAEIVAKD